MGFGSKNNACKTCYSGGLTLPPLPSPQEAGKLESWGVLCSSEAPQETNPSREQGEGRQNLRTVFRPEVWHVVYLLCTGRSALGSEAWLGGDDAGPSS